MRKVVWALEALTLKGWNKTERKGSGKTSTLISYLLHYLNDPQKKRAKISKGEEDIDLFFQK